MVTFKNRINRELFFCIISVLILFTGFNKLSAVENNWTEVAKTNNEIQYIDTTSIKYNSRGFLSVITKATKINSENQEIINSNSYLMAIDCENRLFSKLSVNDDLKQVKDWKTPSNDRLIKITILNSCSY